MSARSNHLPTQDRVRELLEYDADSGEFKWRIDRGRVKKGMAAGSIITITNGARYVQMKIDNHSHYGHVIAWLYTYGSPVPEIDHKDLDGTNNRIDNLRECTRSQNCANRRSRGSKSGYRGVYQRGNIWRAEIRVHGKLERLGNYSDPAVAHAAYAARAKELFGEFAWPSS